VPYRANYPRTVAEILDDAMTFRPAALRALRAFRRSRPWRGTIQERKAKFLTLNRELARAYGLRRPKLLFRSIAPHAEGNGCYIRRPGRRHEITLFGQISVVTYLHEFGHARGYDERRAVRFSVNLFRRMFPVSYASLVPVGHMLCRRSPSA
jgi:hypothetical protein